MPIPDGLNIGVNYAFQGFGTQSLLRQNVRIYLEVLKRLQRETGCRYYYFLHSDGEHLVLRLLAGAGIPVQLVASGPREMLAAYQRMTVHLSQMLHSAILAINAGTPAINVAYDVKAPRFFEMMGMGDYCLGGYDLSVDKYEDSARKLLSNHDRLAAQLKSRKAELLRDRQRHLRAVAECARRYDEAH